MKLAPSQDSKQRRFGRLVAGLLLAVNCLQANAELVDVNGLTGLYHLGDVAEIWPDPAGVLQPATYRQSHVEFAWSGPPPRLLSFEIVGVVGEPSGTALGPLEPDQDLTLVNFNGSFSMPPNVGWGSYVNQAHDFSNGEWTIASTFDASSGRFYFGVIWDTLGYSGWPDIVSNLSADLDAVFYNFMPWGPPGQIDFTDRGFVFIEGARVGLHAEAFELGSEPLNILAEYEGAAVPEPHMASLVLLGMVLLGSATRRNTSSGRHSGVSHVVTHRTPA